jgi:Uma2 family endonuclease
MTTPDVLPVVEPADHVPGPPQGHWTYADYARLPDGAHRYELLNGVLYMAPAPTTPHQSANNLFATYLTIHVQFAGLGRVFTAPTDVELALDVVLQPDVIVVLNASRDIIAHERIIGAPDLVIEIMSPGTAGYDRREKQDAYAHAGVKEYWIADPIGRTVEILVLDGNSYRSRGVFQGQALLPSQAMPNLPVRVEQFFA